MSKLTNLPTHEIIGGIFQQIIEGTIFKYQVLNLVTTYKGRRKFRVENIETGFILIICETELCKTTNKTNILN